MNPISLALHHFHHAIFETYGWALPDSALRRMIPLIPHSLWLAATQTTCMTPPLPEITQWISMNPKIVSKIVKEAQVELEQEQLDQKQLEQEQHILRRAA